MLPLDFGSKNARSSSTEIHEGNIQFKSITIFSGKNIKNHLQKHAVGNVEIATTFREDLYVDDLLGGTEAIEQARQNKEDSIVVFGDATFELHKWHSNIRELHGGERAQDSKKA